MKHEDPRIVVANWKMYLSSQEVKKLLEQGKEEIQGLAKIAKCKIIICPSAENLMLVSEALKAQNVFLGAQTCSPFSQGAYTGQISARSLAEIGCKFCIIAHSEERAHLRENDELIQAQIEQALRSNLVPIFCIGETLEQFNAKQGREIIEKQLRPLFNALKSTSTKTVYVAYEPIWSIGTGNIPQSDYLADMFEYIGKNLKGCVDAHSIKHLYGGSVNGANAEEFWKIPHLSGLLVGKASTDFQMLKKIVLSSIE